MTDEAKPSAADIASLIESSKLNLVFLKGGTFEMGDWGNEDGLPYDSNSESKGGLKSEEQGLAPVRHRVTHRRPAPGSSQATEPAVRG